MISVELRRRIVDAYTRGLSGTYEQTAELFGIGRATVNRILALQRRTGDVRGLPIGGNNPRRVELDWLRKHAETNPDARLIDRIEAWFGQSGVRVASSTMSEAMRAIGWTHKKRLPSRPNKTGRTSSRSAQRM